MGKFRRLIVKGSGRPSSLIGPCPPIICITRNDIWVYPLSRRNRFGYLNQPV